MRFPPPEVTDLWPEPNYIDPDRRGPQSIVIQAILISLSTAIVFIRLYARVVITKAGIGLDDIIIVISLVVGLGLTTGVILAIHNYGWDVHVWDLPKKDLVSSRKVSWACMVLYLTSSSLTKLSILLFYLRILVAKKDKLATKITLVAVVVYYVAFLFVLFLQCRPLQYYWEILIPGAKGKCLEEGIHMVTAGAINVILDIIIFVIPLRSLLKLKIRTSQKLQVISLFSAGLVVIAAAAVRMYYNILVFLDTYDVSWYGYVAWLWAAVEVHLSIICTCVPSCRAFFTSWNRHSTRGSRGTTNPSAHGRSYSNIEEDARRLTSVKMGSVAKAAAGSLRSGVSGDSEEVKEGIRVQMEVMQYHEGHMPQGSNGRKTMAVVSARSART